MVILKSSSDYDHQVAIFRINTAQGTIILTEMRINNILILLICTFKATNVDEFVQIVSVYVCVCVKACVKKKHKIATTQNHGCVLHTYIFVYLPHGILKIFGGCRRITR